MRRQGSEALQGDKGFLYKVKFDRTTITCIHKVSPGSTARHEIFLDLYSMLRRLPLTKVKPDMEQILSVCVMLKLCSTGSNLRRTRGAQLFMNINLWVMWVSCSLRWYISKIRLQTGQIKLCSRLPSVPSVNHNWGRPLNASFGCMDHPGVEAACAAITDCYTQEEYQIIR